MSLPPPANIYGRRAGRGLRPWLLVPKLLAVCCFFGGLVTAFVVLSAEQPPEADAARWEPWLAAVAVIFKYVTVPASVAAAVLGVLLTLQAPRILLAQRWLQVKLLVLFITLPPLHLMARSSLLRLQTHGQSGDLQSMGPLQIMPFVRWPIAAALLIVALIVFLARVKPRLGQNWARTYRRVTRSADVQQ